MALRVRRYPKEEIARRGQALYEEKIRPLVEAGNRGRIVAIDIETGDYALADDTLAAARVLIGRHPDSQIWAERIGFPSVHRIAFVPRPSLRQ